MEGGGSKPRREWESKRRNGERCSEREERERREGRFFSPDVSLGGKRASFCPSYRCKTTCGCHPPMSWPRGRGVRVELASKGKTDWILHCLCPGGRGGA